MATRTPGPRAAAPGLLVVEEEVVEAQRRPGRASGLPLAVYEADRSEVAHRTLDPVALHEVGFVARDLADQVRDRELGRVLGDQEREDRLLVAVVFVRVRLDARLNIVGIVHGSSYLLCAKPRRWFAPPSGRIGLVEASSRERGKVVPPA